MNRMAFSHEEKSSILLEGFRNYSFCNILNHCYFVVLGLQFRIKCNVFVVMPGSCYKIC